jgi:hypothetical protein
MYDNELLGTKKGLYGTQHVFGGQDRSTDSLQKKKLEGVKSGTTFTK